MVELKTEKEIKKGQNRALLFWLLIMILGALFAIISYPFFMMSFGY